MFVKKDVWDFKTPIEPYFDIKHDKIKDKVRILIEVTSEGKMIDSKMWVYCKEMLQRFAEELNTKLFMWKRFESKIKPYSHITHDILTQKVIMSIEVTSEGKTINSEKWVECESIVSAFTEDINTKLFY